MRQASTFLQLLNNTKLFCIQQQKCKINVDSFVSAETHLRVTLLQTIIKVEDQCTCATKIKINQLTSGHNLDCNRVNDARQAWSIQLLYTFFGWDDECMKQEWASSSPASQNKTCS